VIVGPGYATPEVPYYNSSTKPALSVNSSPFDNLLYSSSLDNHTVRQPTRLNGRLYGSLGIVDKRAIVKLYSKEYHKRSISGGDVRTHSRVLSTPILDMLNSSSKSPSTNDKS
jgi:hypothetical protein